VDTFEGDAGRGEEDPSERYSDPAGDISAAPEMGVLRPCTIRGGEESLEEATADGVNDTLEGADICRGADSDETKGGSGADETRGGVEAWVRDPVPDAESGEEPHWVWTHGITAANKET